MEAASQDFISLWERIRVTWPSYLPIGTTFRGTLGWNAPALRAEDAQSLIDDIVERILELAEEADPTTVEAEERLVNLSDQAKLMDFANFASDPTMVARSTFEFLLFANTVLPPKKVDVDWDKVDRAQTIPKALASRLRSLEASITALDPRIVNLAEKASAVESAYDAAEQLPTTLADLGEAQTQIAAFKMKAQSDTAMTEHVMQQVHQQQEKINQLATDAAELVSRCQEAYRITTAVGLAGSFDQRSTALRNAARVWTVILMLSLLSAVAVGQVRFEAIKALLEGEHSWPAVLLNIIFVIVGVGAPIWLAWLSTHYIGRSSRLSEDYAFKASVSKAYEGFRKEAVSLDPEFAKRLFGSALDRLDELPSRLVTKGHHNSPVEALLSHESVRTFISDFPNASERFMKLFQDGKLAVGTLASGVASAATVAPKAATKEPDI